MWSPAQPGINWSDVLGKSVGVEEKEEENLDSFEYYSYSYYSDPDSPLPLAPELGHGNRDGTPPLACGSDAGGATSQSRQPSLLGGDDCESTSCADPSECDENKKSVVLRPRRDTPGEDLMPYSIFSEGGDLRRHIESEGPFFRLGWDSCWTMEALGFAYIGAKKRVLELGKVRPLPKVFEQGGRVTKGAVVLPLADVAAERVRNFAALMQFHEGEFRIVNIAPGRSTDEMDTWIWFPNALPGNTSRHPMFDKQFQPVFDGKDGGCLASAPLRAQVREAWSTLVVQGAGPDGGVYVRNCCVVCFPDLLFYFRDHRTEEEVQRMFEGCPRIVSRRMHFPGRRTLRPWCKGKGMGKGGAGKSSQPLARSVPPPPTPPTAPGDVTSGSDKPRCPATPPWRRTRGDGEAAELHGGSASPERSQEHSPLVREESASPSRRSRSSQRGRRRSRSRRYARSSSSS